MQIKKVAPIIAEKVVNKLCDVIKKKIEKYNTKRKTNKK